ncbi:MAG: acetate--CoA ligase family protein [Candidatus Helarchaeota archaeon]
MSSNLKKLFNPRTVAVFGASNEQGKVGTLIMNNMIACGYEDKIFPINPNRKYENKSILGHDVFPSLDKVPEQVDLAVLIVPGKLVKSTLIDCVEHDVRAAVVISAGFGEAGEEGKKRELELVKIAEKGNLKFVGPNTMGLYSANVNLNVALGYTSPFPGNVSLISQSGSTGVVICSELRGMGIGLRYFVSSGNEASLTFEDYLEYFINDDQTKVVAGFLEGLRNGSKFLEICQKYKGKKPIIILKAGTTRAGTKAANSHTGSISGSYEIYSGAFRQLGVTRARSLDELLDLIRAFLYLPPPKGNRVGIIPGAGGMGVLMADACDRIGLDVSKPSQQLIEKINEILPPYWSHSNPFDPVGTQDFMIYSKLLDIILEANEYDSIIMNVIEVRSLLEKYFPQHETGKQIKKMFIGVMDSIEKSLARKQIKIIKKHSKPVIFMSHVYPYSKLFRRFEKNNVLVVKNPDAAAFVINAVLEHAKIHDGESQG